MINLKSKDENKIPLITNYFDKNNKENIFKTIHLKRGKTKSPYHFRNIMTFPNKGEK